jgi:nitroimidazol reductase NimA-like FMN-containing flavoprotein (pyridoxamine 5'-phosphate oxidase superfamily)
MRRKDRAISRQEALDILQEAEYGILSTVSADGRPYGTPINFCLINDSIYFHCAKEGHKLDNISANNKVCFCVVGKTQLLPEQFGTLYESAVVFGTATEVFDSEKHSALVGMIKKYSEDHYDEGLKYIEKLSSKTGVYKVSIDSISGKAKT